MAKLQHPRTKMTPDAFRELATAAIEELYDNADSFELHDVRAWRQKLNSVITSEVEHRDSDWGFESEQTVECE